MSTPRTVPGAPDREPAHPGAGGGLDRPVIVMETVDLHSIRLRCTECRQISETADEHDGGQLSAVSLWAVIHRCTR